MFSLNQYKSFVFILCLLPLAILLYGAFTDNLGVNPVEAMTRNTGDWAMYFLLMTLAVTPLRKITGFNWLIRYRRMLGLYVFFYALMHLLTYVWFDQYFDWAEIFKDIIKRPFITIGFLSFILLLPLAITSSNKMIRRLKRNWSKIHRLIYLISILVMTHYWLMTKADYKQPVLFLLVLGSLLAYRAVNWRPLSKKV